MVKKRDLLFPSSNFFTALSNSYFEHIPKRVQKIIGPFAGPAYFFVYRIYSIVSDLYPSVRLFSEERNPVGPTSTLWIVGKGNITSIFLDRMVPSESGITPQGRKFLWKIPSMDRSQADAILIEGDRCFSHFLRNRGFIPIPEWVLFTLDLSMPIEEIIGRLKKSEEENLRKIKKFQYTCEKGTDRERLSLFYHKMYLPYIVSRYGKLTLLASFSYMDNLLQKGELLLIKKENEYISGVLITTATSPPTVAFLGVKDGRKDLVKLGAVSALYYYSILWAKERGYSQLDFGHCRPFLKDGVLLYKKRWGMRINRSQTKHRMIFLSMNRLSPLLEKFFIDHPLVYEDKGQLKGLLFVKKENQLTEEETEALKKKYFIQGLKGVSIVSLEAPFTHPSQ